MVMKRFITGAPYSSLSLISPITGLCTLVTEPSAHYFVYPTSPAGVVASAHAHPTYRDLTFT